MSKKKSKITVNKHNFGRSKITFRNHTFGRSKITANKRILDCLNGHWSKFADICCSFGGYHKKKKKKKKKMVQNYGPQP